MPRAASLMLCLALGFGMAAPGGAQTPEIFIPGATDALPIETGPEPGNALARCLKAPDESCAAVGADGEEGLAFESAADLRFETLVLDLTDSTVTKSDAPPAAPTDYAATVPPDQGRIALPSVAITIQFDHDSALIRADQRERIAALVEALRDPALAGTAYAVIGHTDATGPAAYNCDLSRRRAAEVTRTLQAAYVMLPLYPLGFGESVLGNVHDPAAAENRRVTFLRLPDDRGAIMRTAASVCAS